MVLTPCFWRFSSYIIAILIVILLIVFYYQGYVIGNRENANAALSLIIPTILLPLFIWIVFVPEKLSYSDNEITIKMRFGQLNTIGWTDLKYYGTGRGVFLLEFNDCPTFQIFSIAFPTNQWAQFTTFLGNRFPEREAKGWVGTNGFGSQD